VSANIPSTSPKYASYGLIFDFDSHFIPATVNCPLMRIQPIPGIAIFVTLNSFALDWMPAMIRLMSIWGV
jgi:hypothetical protein